jgi:Cytochrome P460
MKRLTPLLIAVATLAGVVALTARAPRHAAAQQAAPIFVTAIPSGYRDWRLISVAHEEGDLHSFAAVLGNDVAIKAYREGKVSFPDGTIIAALHYRHVPSEENNKVFGRDQSFVAGPPTNIQFMVKDSKKYTATSLTRGTRLPHRWARDSSYGLLLLRRPAAQLSFRRRQRVGVENDRQAILA